MLQEIEKGESDILDIQEQASAIVVNEPKCRVDLTKFTEEHVFKFDACLNEGISNDSVYRLTVMPLLDTVLDGGYATCFAYGQTGSGKTFTMQVYVVTLSHLQGIACLFGWVAKTL